MGRASLTVSPRSPFLPAGPTGPGAPGAPGAPGGPAGPVSPRSPCEEEEEEEEDECSARASAAPAPPPSTPTVGTHLGTSSTIATGGTFGTGSTLWESRDPSLGHANEVLGGTGLDLSTHGCHEPARAQRSKPTPPPLHPPAPHRCSPHVQLRQGGQPGRGGPWGREDRAHQENQRDLACRVRPTEGRAHGDASDTGEHPPASGGPHR